MKGYRFFLEFDEEGDNNHTTVKKLTNDYDNQSHSGNVLALFLDNNGRPLYGPTYNMDCIYALFYQRNSSVCGGSCSHAYLDKNTKRIPESLARKIHPVLFARLDE